MPIWLAIAGGMLLFGYDLGISVAAGGAAALVTTLLDIGLHSYDAHASRRKRLVGKFNDYWRS